MRVGQYLIERNIGLATFEYLCDYLSLDLLKLTAKLSNSKIALLDITLNSGSFQEWLQIRLTLDNIEIKTAKNLIAPLFYNSTIQIDELLGERILNALLLLIHRHFYRKVKPTLLSILLSDKPILDKITLLKSSAPFLKPTPSPYTKKRMIGRKNNDSDLFDNFFWGGLRGEEAYISYWNTD